MDGWNSSVHGLIGHVEVSQLVDLMDPGFCIAVGGFRREEVFSLYSRKDLEKAMINLLGLHSHLLGVICLNLIHHLESLLPSP